MKDYTLLLFLILITSSSLSCSSVFRTAHAQSPPPSPVTNSNINTTLPMLFVVFVFAFFITIFCSIYIRFCAPEPIHAPFPPTRRRGIDPRVLATCPVISYIKTKAKSGGASQCAVCLAEFENGDALRVLPTCGHVFHAPCIDAWLAAHVTCPVCRGEVSADFEGVARGRHVFEESSMRESDAKMLRSHSTGHSLEGSVVIRMHRSASYDVVLRIGEMGEGSNNNNNNNKKWVWSMTPPFVSVVREEKECERRTVFEVV